MFEYRHQPYKSLFILYSGLSILFVRLPLWVARSSIPSWRPRPNWTLTRSVVVHLVNALVDTLYKINGTDQILPETNEKQKEKLGFVWVDPVGEEWVKGEVKEIATVNKIEPVRVWGYWYGKRGGDGKHAQRALKGEKVLYHLHGGGYTRGSGSPKSDTAAIPTGILTECSGLIDRAFCLDYRLSSAAPFTPANHFPAALLDALAGYFYLLNEIGFAAEDIVLSGDSAGGHLAITLARYIVELNKPASCPLPKTLLLLSPTTDWACTHDDRPGSSMTVNADSDFVSTVLKGGYTASALLGNLPPSAIASNAWLSPASLKLDKIEGLFGKFPKTCIVAGGAEQTLDGMKTFRDRLVRDVGKEGVLYLEYEDAVHDFIGLTIHEPERSLALKEIHRWLKKEMPA